MSQRDVDLMNLIRAYGDARADWMAGGVNRVPEALAAIEHCLGLDACAAAANQAGPTVGQAGTAVAIGALLGRKVTAETAYLLPPPRYSRCAAGCGHDIYVHSAIGCNVWPCACPAPHGRILPSAEVQE